MKNIFKRLFSLTLAVVMMAGFTLTASAAGKVTYEGEAEKFIFEPGTEYSATDLFGDFKNVMPGDKITQKISVVNNGKRKHTTKIYMKALGPTDENNSDLRYSDEEGNLGDGNDNDGYTDKALYQPLLNQLELTVVAVEGNTKLFEAAANETDGLSDWVLLGSLRKGGEVELEVTLEVPAELGNEFQDMAGAIDWAFKVEEIKDKNKKPPVIPNTGDISNIMLYAGMFGLAALALMILIILKRKAKEEK